MKRNEPHAKELYRNCVTESLLETPCQIFVVRIIVLVQIVRERDVLEIILG